MTSNTYSCKKHPTYDGVYPADKNCKACRKIRKEAKAEGRAKKVAPERSKDTFSIMGDNAEVTQTSNHRVMSLDDLVRVCAIDLNVWEVERFICNKWEMGSVPSGDPIVTPLFQVKAWLKRKVSLVAARDEVRDLLNTSKKLFPVRLSLIFRTIKTGNMLEVNIPDLHLGKLAWGPETGYRSYDSKLAEKTHDQALQGILERTRGYSLDKVIYVVGNDLLHSDTKVGTTTSGTLLDTDSRFQKNFLRVRNMTIRAIESLRVIAPIVQVVMVSGNHDALSTWHLGDSLECFYHNTDSVHIDNTPALRKYQEFGKVMLMFTHGYRGKLKEYPILMATEQPKMFGRTKFREVHTGHKHTLQVQEVNGVRVRILPALCPPDAWHSEMTFVGNLESVEAFIWNKDSGLIGTAVYNVC